jgi:hypothetical protein
MQLHCHAPLAVLLDRYARRSRHPGHHDTEIQLDTTEPVDVDAMAERLRSAL